MPTTLRSLLLVPALLLATAAAQTADQGPASAPPRGSVESLLDEIDDLRAAVENLRLELAQARLDGAAAERQVDELRQYIEDHDQYGRDFQQYRAVLAQAQRAARQQQADAARQQRQADRAEKREAAQADRMKRDAYLQRAKQYSDAGFTPVGLDVYLGNAAFNYQTWDGVPARVDWNGLTGRFIRLYPPVQQVDFSSMTFSGSVLNASNIVRDIGVAITFFDESGNQVGGDIIQVNHARPDVPYPFTSTIAMALNRPFASSSTYVLYADPSD